MMMKALKKLVKKWLPQHKAFQRIYLGFYYFGIWGMNYGIGGNIHQTGEANVLKFLKKRLRGKKTPVLFDVGANVGDYTVLLKNTFPQAEIHAFEPIAPTYSQLQAQVASLHEVQVHNIGFGDKEEQVLVDYNPSLLSQFSLVPAKGKGTNTRHQETISIETLDQFCEKAGISHIDFLKIDVEGFEIKVLKGAERLIRNKGIDCIQFEFGGTQVGAKVFFRDFWDTLSSDYELFRILKNNLYPIKSYAEHLEVFPFL